MDTITQDRLRSEWHSWISENDVNFVREYSGASRTLIAGDYDPQKLRCTAYVKNGEGYKLFRRSIPDLGHKALAWRFPVPVQTTTRDIFHRASRIVEASPLGLELLLGSRAPEIRAEAFRFGFGPVELCEEHFGPPPADADYVEIDWRLRRMKRAYTARQTEAYIMGPERVRRCLRGLAATGVKFAYDACAALEISHKTLREWVEAGTEFVTDEYVMMEQARKPLPRTRYADRIRPVLELAGYERFSPPAGYWTVNEALAQ